MTKGELRDYIDELHRVIENAHRELKLGRQEEAKAILNPYRDEETKPKYEWKLNEAGLALELYDQNGHQEYWVDLERCRTSAEVLDWIVQVAGKNFGSDRVIGALVCAMDRLMNLQLNMCSGGVERGPIKVKDILKRRAVGAILSNRVG